MTTVNIVARHLMSLSYSSLIVTITSSDRISKRIRMTSRNIHVFAVAFHQTNERIRAMRTITPCANDANNIISLFIIINRGNVTDQTGSDDKQQPACGNATACSTTRRGICGATAMLPCSFYVFVKRRLLCMLACVSVNHLFDNKPSA